MIKATINNIEVEVKEGTTILEAAKKAGFIIPTLCYHPDLKPKGSCGICVVEVEGMPALKRACMTEVVNGWRIHTNTPSVRTTRKTLVELILADHDMDCPTCIKNNRCELQSLAATLGITDIRYRKSDEAKKKIDDTSLSIVRNPNKCILCERCIQVCEEIQTVNALALSKRGSETIITDAFDVGIGNSVCVNCGQCTVFCPVGALYEKSDIEKVWEAINDPEKHVVVQEAPAIRAMLGEEFGMEPGTLVAGKMHAALRRMRFDAVFDTNFTADLTILEEGTEIVGRITGGGKLPVITSCSPGWVKFMETFYPHLSEYVSTAKSPQQMFGALSKTYYAEIKGIPPEKIVSVSIMPCTAKKFECKRPEMTDSGYTDVDYVLTTREIARMLKEAGIDLKDMPDEPADDPMGEYTGAATIFGVTGGVMEAALRSAYFLVTGRELENVDIVAVRGMEGIKEAEIDVGGLKLKVAVAHGLGNARKILDKVTGQLKNNGKSEYHAIEIMACPGGCVGGGGQPWGSDMARRARRGETLLEEDRSLPYRRSHENPSIKLVYERYLEKPNSEKAHHLLHTHYFKRSRIDGKIIND
ncbi:MAG: [FeFe] hydrogenase, group A [Syntrophorhabdaceae bacterium]|nr:[FeFe] hydrogenase, group A [Syntrophorhabdales bacterium]MBP9560985.1 [FeFe] hydrogenase, group A [Syntrophorhabdaceae bacterium]